MWKEKDWSKRLSKFRKKMGWSQQELADEFRVSEAAVGHWETGKRKMLGPATRLLELYEKDLDFCLQKKK